MKSDSDRSLLIQVKQSDKNAYKELFYKYHPILFRFVYYRTNDYSLTDDIVQETFVKVWLNRKSLKPDKSFFSLIAKISANLYYDHLKRENVRIKHRDSIPTPTQSYYDDPETDYNVNLLENEIHRVANDFLPDKCRTVFILSRFEGRTNQEIADLLNITKKTVENQLYKALKVLKKKLINFL